MIKAVNRKDNRAKRHKRVRKKISGTPERPRLAVFRSDKHFYAQIIDDINKKTLVECSTLDKELNLEHTHNKEAAEKVGEMIAKRALDAGIENVVFDRGGFIYHGRVQAMAEGARKAGLKF